MPLGAKAAAAAEPVVIVQSSSFSVGSFLLGVLWGRYLLELDEVMGSGAEVAFVYACAAALTLAFLAYGCYQAMKLVGAARRERFGVAAQLAAFDVRATQAWSDADKAYVLSQICEW